MVRPVWLNGSVFVYELSGCEFEPHCCHLNFRQTIECGFTLKLVRHMIITCSHASVYCFLKLLAVGKSKLIKEQPRLVAKDFLDLASTNSLQQICVSKVSKYGPQKTSYLDTFHAVTMIFIITSLSSVINLGRLVQLFELISFSKSNINGERRVMTDLHLSQPPFSIFAGNLNKITVCFFSKNKLGESKILKLLVHLACSENLSYNLWPNIFGIYQVSLKIFI